MKPGQKFSPLAHCHAKGIFSIPLFVCDSYVERMFIDTLGTCHTIAPHSHRYPLDIKLVHGSLAHSIWEPHSLGAVAMYEFEWQSPLLDEPGKFRRLYEQPVRYNVATKPLTASGIALDSEQIHSLVTTPGTAWIVTEHLDEEDSITLHHSPEYAPDLSGLYVPIGDPLDGPDLPF